MNRTLLAVSLILVTLVAVFAYWDSIFNSFLLADLGW